MKFLIVEDDPDCQKLLQVYLSTYAELHTADNGRDAVLAYTDSLDAGEPFKLICMDIMMPGMDGHEALAAIRRLETDRGLARHQWVKVIMTTALKDSDHAKKAFFNEGCEAYLVKPIKKQALVKWLEQLGVAFAHTG